MRTTSRYISLTNVLGGRRIAHCSGGSGGYRVLSSSIAHKRISPTINASLGPYSLDDDGGALVAISLRHVERDGALGEGRQILGDPDIAHTVKEMAVASGKSHDELVLALEHDGSVTRYITIRGRGLLLEGYGEEAAGDGLSHWWGLAEEFGDEMRVIEVEDWLCCLAETTLAFEWALHIRTAHN